MNSKLNIITDMDKFEKDLANKLFTFNSLEELFNLERQHEQHGVVSLYPTKHTGYLVTKTGRVFSAKSEKIKELKQNDTWNGYKYLNLSNQGKKINVRVHRLVAETFIGNIDGLDVNHLDCDKTNNDISNLEPCPHEENIKHYHRMKKLLKPTREAFTK